MRPRNVPTSQPHINQGGKKGGAPSQPLFLQSIFHVQSLREGFAELVKDGSCARQRGGRTIWRGEKEKGTLKMENYAKQEERHWGKGGREAERRWGMGRQEAGREP